MEDNSLRVDKIAALSLVKPSTPSTESLDRYLNDDSLLPATPKNAGERLSFRFDATVNEVGCENIFFKYLMLV